MKRALFLFLLAAGTLSADPLKIVTTTPDLADIARRVGGARVTVESLSRGFQDPHFVEAKPSLVLKLRGADLFIQTGLDLEVGWAPLLWQGARRPGIQPGGAAFLDASVFIEPMEVPTDVSRAGGDVHPGGNPHYLADPRNAARVAEGIARKLAERDPAGAGDYAANADAYVKTLERRMDDWNKRLAPLRGALFVSYHRNLAYFADWAGLESAGEIEPKPGIPPSPRHTADLIRLMQERKVRLILTAPYFEKRSPDALARATGARVVVLSLGPDAVPGVDDYIAAMDRNVVEILGGGRP
jgi:zinc/manganese transport system substrate-binding protein